MVLDNLPILPEEFPLAVLPDTKAQFNALTKLIRRKDVEVIVNGCDAGREGELIFKYILKQATNRTVESKRIQRLWLQSMTLDAIRDGLGKLKDNEEMLPLEDTALCRSEADWLIGINATRALTCYNSRFGGFARPPAAGCRPRPCRCWSSGRSNGVSSFPVTYWELHARFGCGPVQYEGVWIDPAFAKDDEQSHGRRNRIWEEQRAAAVVERCTGKPAVVEETNKKSTKGAPPLYDLTLLQREANSRFGFSAKNTLSLAQALYERHKLITYPRTDSRCLPEDYLPTVEKVVLRQKEGQYGRFAAEALAKNYLKKDKRIFDNKKISDHFAIIPTTGLPKSLSEPELKIYQMIVQRFLAVFFPPAVYHNTRRLSLVEGETFLTEGKDPGRAGLEGHLRIGERGGRRQGTAGPATRPPSMRGNRQAGASDQAAAPFQRGDPALGHGKFGQADRGRGTGRGDEGTGAGHTGDQGRDHREADQ
jgi:DNA topoisomerase III